MTSSPEIPGYNTEAVEAWIGRTCRSLEAPFDWTRCEGGHSNLTYLLEDANGNKAVVRRPPQGKLLPKAHDMKREYSIIEALWPTPVPVAEPLGFCDSIEVTGAVFYLMSFIEGRSIFLIDDVLEWVPEEARQNLGYSMIETLAHLHSVDPDAVGLGELARKHGYIERQLKIWYGSWNASKDAAQIDDPVIHELHDQLVKALPDQGPARLVHGDFGMHNTMFDSAGNVNAIIDWEISTLGDPLADLAYLLNAWVQPDDIPTPQADAPTLAPGFPTRDELANRYSELTGRDLGQLRYYRAFNDFKSACILHGVYARYANGQKAIADDDLAELRNRVQRTVEKARTSLKFESTN